MLKRTSWCAASMVLLAVAAGCERGGGAVSGQGSREGNAGVAEPRQVSLTVQGLDSTGAEEAVKGLLGEQGGVGSVAVDRGAGLVSFKLAAPGSVDRVVSALTDAGYPAREVEHAMSEHPEASKTSEHPEHPR